jgi:hypothetical protein
MRTISASDRRRPDRRARSGQRRILPRGAGPEASTGPAAQSPRGTPQGEGLFQRHPPRVDPSPPGSSERSVVTRRKRRGCGGVGGKNPNKIAVVAPGGTRTAVETVRARGLPLLARVRGADEHGPLARLLRFLGPLTTAGGHLGARLARAAGRPQSNVPMSPAPTLSWAWRDQRSNATDPAEAERKRRRAPTSALPDGSLCPSPARASGILGGRGSFPRRLGQLQTLTMRPSRRGWGNWYRTASRRFPSTAPWPGAGAAGSGTGVRAAHGRAACDLPGWESGAGRAGLRVRRRLVLHLEQHAAYGLRDHRPHRSIRDPRPLGAAAGGLGGGGNCGTGG